MSNFNYSNIPTNHYQFVKIEEVSTRVDNYREGLQEELNKAERRKQDYNELERLISVHNTNIRACRDALMSIKSILNDEFDSERSAALTFLPPHYSDDDGNIRMIEKEVIIDDQLPKILSEHHQFWIQEINAQIDFLQKLDQDAKEFQNQALQLREQGKHEEAEEFEAKVRFIGDLLTDSNSFIGAMEGKNPNLLYR